MSPTVEAEAKVEIPVTSSVPAIEVSPVVSATVNLLVSTARPAFALSKLENVAIPVTAKVVAT